MNLPEKITPPFPCPIPFLQQEFQAYVRLPSCEYRDPSSNHCAGEWRFFSLCRELVLWSQSVHRSAFPHNEQDMTEHRILALLFSEGMWLLEQSLRDSHARRRMVPQLALTARANLYRFVYHAVVEKESILPVTLMPEGHRVLCLYAKTSAREEDQNKLQLHPVAPSTLYVALKKMRKDLCRLPD